MKPKKNKPKSGNAKKPSKRSSQASAAPRTAAPQELTTPTPSTTPSATGATPATTSSAASSTTSSTSNITNATPRAAESGPLSMGAMISFAAAAMVAFSAEALRLALEFVLIACPKEGPFSVVVFDSDEQGVPVIAAHDAVRCHMAFLPKNAWCMARGTVSHKSVKKLVKLLRGLDRDDNDTVTIASTGRVEVLRSDQSPLPHRLDFKSLEPGLWQPPRDTGARATHAPLVLPSDPLQRAVRYPGAVVRIEQRTSARVVINVERDGEVVARAVIAEQGQELYPSDPPAQVTFPFGERSSAPRQTSLPIVPASVQRAADELRAKLQGHREESAEPSQEREVAHDAQTPAFPEPGALPVVVEIPEGLVDELSPEAIESLRLPPGVDAPVFWINAPDRRVSGSLTAPIARAVAAACEALGLACEEANPGRRHGIEVTVWTVGRAGEKGAAQ